MSMNQNSPSRRPQFVSRPAAWRLAVAAAVVSGVFSLIVCVLLIANYLQITALDPLNQLELLELRAQFAEAPETDPQVIEQIRTMDLLARKAFITSQEHLRAGGQLLLGGVAILLISLKLAARWRPRLPAPEGAPAEGAQAEAGRTKELIAFAAIALVTLSLLAAYWTPLDIPRAEVAAPAAPDSETPEPAATPTAFPNWETVQQQWPSFRGPGGLGVALHTNVPLDWNVESGRNILWKTELPAIDFNSPVVWGDHLFLSSATAEKREVFCYDTAAGELRWQRALPAFPGTPAEAPRVTEDTGYAAPTMAVHGGYAFAIFANGDIACFDFEGNQRWGRNLGVPDNHYGHSSSLIAYDNLLFVQYDEKTQPRLLALSISDGKDVWKAERRKISWASPALIHTPKGLQLILNSELDVDAYDPASGRLLWTQECLDGEVAPSPAYAKGILFAANEYAMGSAITLDFSGAETKSTVAWEWDESLPEVASPVATDTHVYIATSMGDVVCLDLGSGKAAWAHEFDDGFYASPILAGDRVYLTDMGGITHVFRTGPEFELLASSSFGESAFATPAFLDGRIYARTEKHLLCIGSTE